MSDVKKLPKWAQNLIYKLERDLESAHAKLSAGPEDSNTIADPHSDPFRPLGTDTTIRFKVGEEWHEYIDVRVRTDHKGESYIYLMGGDSISIEPESSNTATVRLRRR